MVNNEHCVHPLDIVSHIFTLLHIPGLVHFYYHFKLLLKTYTCSSALFSLLQQPGASTTTVTRMVASLSLVCSTMAVIYGSLYIIRFSGMKGLSRAAGWAEVNFVVSFLLISMSP